MRLIGFLCRRHDLSLSNPLTCRGPLSSESLSQKQEHGLIWQAQGPLCWIQDQEQIADEDSEAWTLGLWTSSLVSPMSGS